MKKQCFLRGNERDVSSQKILALNFYTYLAKGDLGWLGQNQLNLWVASCIDARLMKIMQLCLHSSHDDGYFCKLLPWCKHGRNVRSTLQHANLYFNWMINLVESDPSACDNLWVIPDSRALSFLCTWQNRSPWVGRWCFSWPTHGPWSRQSDLQSSSTCRYPPHYCKCGCFSDPF